MGEDWAVANEIDGGEQSWRSRGSRNLGRLEAGVAQVETVEHRVVVVAWNRVPVAGKSHCVGALEVNHATIILGSVRMLNQVVETVSVMGHYLDRLAPPALGSGN